MLGRVLMFQSYQFRQINPDVGNASKNRMGNKSFNRINSGRSIPTTNYLRKQVKKAMLVSIVSIQADQSRHFQSVLLSVTV